MGILIPGSRETLDSLEGCPWPPAEGHCLNKQSQH
jgi:hypothetical protein